MNVCQGDNQENFKNLENRECHEISAIFGLHNSFWLVILRILGRYLGKGLLKSQGGYELEREEFIFKETQYLVVFFSW